MSIRSGVTKAAIIAFLCIAIFGTAGFFAYRLANPPVKKAAGDHSRGGLLPPDPSIAAFDHAQKLRSDGKLAEARNELQDFVANYTESPKLDEAKKALGEINLGLLFSEAPDPGKQQYTIQKGDTIGAIERKVRLPSEMIMRLNKIDDPTKLHIGQVLNVSKPEFSVKINRKSKVITLMDSGRFFKEYTAESWNAPNPKSNAPIQAKVAEKVAWKNNQRVSFGTKEYAESGRWISFSVAGYSLYSQDMAGTPKPPGGIGLPEGDMDELSTLLNKGTPVTIE